MRSALWQRPVTYAAVGATKAHDLLRHPPSGYRPVERRARIGHGDARFEYACAKALSWGVQRNSGFRVRLAEGPEEEQVGPYQPVVFDADGVPLARPEDTETVYGPDGTAFLNPGDTAWLMVPLLGPVGLRAPVRVVYVLDEPKRKGFAYGTLEGHPADGEEAFIVEQREDGSVWMVVRAFSRPAHRGWWIGYPFLRLMQAAYIRRYLRALAGPIE